MLIAIKAVLVVLFADFVTGVVHWLEDSYFSLDTPILGKWLVEPNLAHHQNGQDFLKKSWFESSWDLLLASVLLVAICLLMGKMSWEVALFAFIIANANQIHKWAHITRDERKPWVVGLLQRAYVLQRTSHHGKHHRKPNDSHYCTVTNMLNPVLDYTHFWRILEQIIGKKRSIIG